MTIFDYAEVALGLMLDCSVFLLVAVELLHLLLFVRFFVGLFVCLFLFTLLFFALLRFAVCVFVCLFAVLFLSCCFQSQMFSSSILGDLIAGVLDLLNEAQTQQPEVWKSFPT